jgi:hypothetical protein
MMKSKITGGLLLALACAVLFAPAHADAQTRRTKGWRGIVPLHSTHADVLRRVGKPAADKESYSEYDFEGVENVRLFYSDGKGCATGDWRVPRGTVLSIYVTPRKDNPPLRLSDLRLDLRRLRKEKGSGDVQARTIYKDERAGVTYEVFGEDAGPDAQVMSIQYGPASGDRRLRCRERKPPPR